jgi:bifunctional non-homologous end joining protein LigD
MRGERMKGEWALVRMHRGDGRQWLLIKHRDRWAHAGGNLTGRALRSVTTGRTMREIAAAGMPDPEDDMPRDTPGAVAPMLAEVGSEVPAGKRWAFEPKYDGIRVIAYADGSAVTLMTRNQADKSAQFPEIIAAVGALSRRKRTPLVLDGEIVARRARAPARFQVLQERIHQTDATTIARRMKDVPAELVVFDLLMDRTRSYIDEPYSVRRRQLKKLFTGVRSSALELSISRAGNGAKLLARARKSGWEGIMAKRTDATYQPDVRSPDWLKLKLEARQEFVVGGWTEPRGSRQHIGAILLGYWKGRALIYAGHTGGGFNRTTLKEMADRLAPLEIAAPPFARTPHTNAPAHWTRPEVVVEVKFNEWTEDGSLRQPILLGVRDDKSGRAVRREAPSLQQSRRKIRPQATAPGGARRTAGGSRVVTQLRAIEDDGGNGTVRFPDGTTLDVTNLSKRYFPKQHFTKGDVMRYYASIAKTVLPLMADRPLVLKRFPNGIDAAPFFQQNAPNDVPKGIRTETVQTDDGESTRIVGGDLPTLLYTVQLGAIELHPWLSRIKSLQYADYFVLDLDPTPGASFALVMKVAQHTLSALTKTGFHAAMKTSGSRGLHLFVRMAPRTTYERASEIARIIATAIADEYPGEATVERMKKKRPPGTVYVDFLQNAEGKSVAGAFSVRARDGAPVSMPIAEAELRRALHITDFTLANAAAQAAARGKTWKRGLRRPTRTSGSGAAHRPR